MPVTGNRTVFPNPNQPLLGNGLTLLEYYAGQVAAGMTAARPVTDAAPLGEAATNARLLRARECWEMAQALIDTHPDNRR